MEAREFIEKEHMNESKKPKKVVRNDKGEVVPEHCSCGGKIGVFIEGEPIYKCTACGKYYGTMPFPKKALNEVAYSDDIVWITYGSDAFDPSRFKVPQPCNSVANKPLNGLWACPLNSRYGWEAWCREEGFKTARLNSSFTFKLKPDAKIYVIDNLDDLINISTYHYFSEWLIDVNRLLSEGYDGIYATENAIKLRDCYKTPRGTVEGLGCWDAESICIFNPNVIIPLNKENKNMKKNVIKLNEAQLREMIANAIQTALNEDTKAQRKKDPMNQWFKDADKLSRLRDMSNPTYDAERQKNIDKTLKESAEGDERFLPELKKTYGKLRKEYERWQYSTYKPQGMDDAIDAIIDAMHSVQDIIKKIEPNDNVPTWEDPQQY